MCEKTNFFGCGNVSQTVGFVDCEIDMDSGEEEGTSLEKKVQEIVQRVPMASIPSALSTPKFATEKPCQAEEEMKACMYEALKNKTRALEDIKILNDDEVDSRFLDMGCPRATAVVVDSKYLHANYVNDGKTPRTFVASQLPYEKRLFWKFILENDFDIIDLHTLDSGYAPSEQTGQLQFDSIIVQFVKKIDECTFEYEVRDSVSQMKRQVRRHHFTGWRDTYSVTVTKLQELVSLLETTFTRNTLVHCLAGIGRTGTLIAAYFTKQQIRSGIIRHENLEMALVDLIVELRKQRGSRFVQNVEQFGLLVDFALALLHS